MRVRSAPHPGHAVARGVIVRSVDALGACAALGHIRRLRIRILAVRAALVIGEARARRSRLIDRIALGNRSARVGAGGGKAAVIDIHAVGDCAARGADNVDAFGSIQCAARHAHAAVVGHRCAGPIRRNRTGAAGRIGLARGHIVHLAIADGLRGFGAVRMHCLAIRYAGGEEGSGNHGEDQLVHLNVSVGHVFGTSATVSAAECDCARASFDAAFLHSLQQRGGES